MEINDYFEKTGTEDEIENSMIENIAYNKANAALLVSIIHNNEALLSDDECCSHDFYCCKSCKERCNVILKKQ